MTPRSDSVRTREALLDAAERLIAAQGIQAVSLRAINAGAGARNVSAAHYHFGSKEAVVGAAIARRMAQLAEERLAALDAVEVAAAGGVPDLRGLVEAIVAPFIGMLADPRGADPVTFLARAGAEPGITLEQHAPPAFWRMIQRFAGLLQRALPGLPDRVLLLRVRFLVQQCFVLVTELQRLAGGPGTQARQREVDVVGADLVDYLVGGLAAASGSAVESRPAIGKAPRSIPRATRRRRRSLDANHRRSVSRGARAPDLS